MKKEDQKRLRHLRRTIDAAAGAAREISDLHAHYWGTGDALFERIHVEGPDQALSRLEQLRDACK